MGEILQFRKKPVVVQAIQWTGDADAVRELTSYPLFEVFNDDKAKVYDKLQKCWVDLELNHWIIKGLDGELYPCDPDMFEKIYELYTGEKED